MVAAITGDTAKLTELLAGGADVQAEDSRGWTALSFAAVGGHVEAVKLLCAAPFSNRCSTWWAPCSGAASVGEWCSAKPC